MRAGGDAPVVWQFLRGMHRSETLEHLFNRCFLESYQTQLEGGGAEPLYLPSEDLALRPHRVVYREDFFASALHEAAHWCVAGSARRKLEDYGYWYAPDGRDAEQQAAFEQAETKPQALEWIFSDACGFDFNLSADNLAGAQGPSPAFEQAVRQQKQRYQAEGLGPRAALFAARLAEAFSTTR